MPRRFLNDLSEETRWPRRFEDVSSNLQQLELRDKVVQGQGRIASRKYPSAISSLVKSSRVERPCSTSQFKHCEVSIMSNGFLKSRQSIFSNSGVRIDWEFRITDVPHNTELLRGLKPREIDLILAAGRPCRFRAKSVMTYQGDPAQYLLLLWKGRARYFYDRLVNAMRRSRFGECIQCLRDLQSWRVAMKVR